METYVHDDSERLRAAALALPGVTEGTSCVNRAFRAGKKAFFYLGEKKGQIYAMVKLGPSLEEVAASDDPRVSVGNIGWATLRFDPGDAPEGCVAWVEESYRMLAPRSLVKQLG